MMKNILVQQKRLKHVVTGKHLLNPVFPKEVPKQQPFFLEYFQNNKIKFWWLFSPNLRLYF